MEERGLLARDLAFILGVPEQSLNTILSAKRGISPDMARALGEAFDVPSEFFMNLQQAYDLSRAATPDPGVAIRAKMQTRYPVREMMKRGWIQQSDAAMLELQLQRFFKVDSSDEIPYMAHAAKKSRYEERAIQPEQLAWLFRIKQIAESISVPAYSVRKLREAIGDLEALLHTPEETRHVPRMLLECGIKFVIVERLPHADIDGVCFWDGQTPVIGMSMRYDRIDNFWFVLRHEIEHVLQEHGRIDEMEMLDDLDEQLLLSSDTLPKEEQIANAAAVDFCAPTAKLDNFLKRKHPFYYEKDVIAFAHLYNRHPGLIVGQIRKRLNRFDYLTRHLVKVRQFVLPGAITDGWGQVMPVEL
jgi:HTH-type transcriptional regulator/antitoxin HigA